MKLRCGVHAERERADRPMFICHHCGMPVCEEHGWVVLADDAFAVTEEPVSRAAMHCPECVAAYHPRGASKRRGWLSRQLRAAGQYGQATTPAMSPQQQPPAQQPPGYGQPPGYNPPPGYYQQPGYSPPGPSQQASA